MKEWQDNEKLNIKNCVNIGVRQLSKSQYKNMQGITEITQ